jgi:hypothetical protein
MPPPAKDDNWNESRRHVNSELDRLAGNAHADRGSINGLSIRIAILESTLASTVDELAKVRKDAGDAQDTANTAVARVAVIETKNAITGAIAGLITSGIVALAVRYLSKT